MLIARRIVDLSNARSALCKLLIKDKGEVNNYDWTFLKCQLTVCLGKVQEIVHKFTAELESKNKCTHTSCNATFKKYSYAVAMYLDRNSRIRVKVPVKEPAEIRRDDYGERGARGRRQRTENNGGGFVTGLTSILTSRLTLKDRVPRRAPVTVTLAPCCFYIDRSPGLRDRHDFPIRRLSPFLFFPPFRTDHRDTRTLYAFVSLHN